MAAAASRVATALAAVAVLACFVLVCWAVGARYFFNRPLTWSDEVTGWLVVAMVMLAVADAQRRGENIGVDLLLERTRGRVRRALVALGVAMVAVCAAMILVHGIEMVQFSRMLDLRSNTLGAVGVWVVQLLVPIGAALLLVVALAQLVVVAAGGTPEGYAESHGDGAPKAGIE
ncbi:MAG: TRAP transporter small permease [Alphaproteobacteria bacterium]|nr:TRAP transporter small permease [Alphaproteobacteria bacterium]